MQERAGGRQQGRIKRRENDLKRKTKGGKLNGNRKIVTFCMINVGRKQLQNLRCDFAILNKKKEEMTDLLKSSSVLTLLQISAHLAITTNL